MKEVGRDGEVTKYRYTALPDGFPANPRGVPTRVIDPRGGEELRWVNELDQVVVRVRKDGDGALSGSGSREVMIYDANGNVVEKRVYDDALADVFAADDVPGDVPSVVYRYGYDILDQRIAETIETPSGSVTNTYGYDASQNLVEVVRDLGGPGESVERWTYDERDVPVTHIRDAGTPRATTLRSVIDADGNVVEWVDAGG